MARYTKEETAQAQDKLRELIPLDTNSGMNYEGSPALPTIRVTFVQLNRPLSQPTRQYVVLVPHKGEIWDITSTVCKALGYGWNDRRGTLSSTNHAEDHASQLAYRLYGLGYYMPVKVI